MALTKEENAIEAVQKAIQTFGHIDVLVNNAGIAIDQTFEDKTDFEFRKVLDVNLIGPFLMSKEVGKRMQEQGHGKIINVSSTNAIDTLYPESMDYDASKAGLINKKFSYNFCADNPSKCSSSRMGKYRNE